MSRRALLLLIVVLIAHLPQLLFSDWHGTEGRRVQIATEMAVSGNWMVPTLGWEPTYAKPPLHYWMLASVQRLFGDGFLAMRVPTLVGLWLLSVLGLELLRRRFGSAAGWVAALGIVLSPLLLFEAASAEIDPLFAFFTAASIWCLACGVADGGRGLVFAGGVLGGLAMLHKGPPFLMFAAGAWLAWLRHRGLRQGLWYFVPLAAVPLAYYVPLWLWYVPVDRFAGIAREESIGRATGLAWEHVLETPAYWLRAAGMLLPLGAWCFWEWRGTRDARMGPADLTLRMCSGAAVFGVLVLTFFPGRPTRYLLPNLPLFVFAVAPAVAHFAGQRRLLGSFSHKVLLRLFGVLGASAMLAAPFLPGSAPWSIGLLGFAFALAPFAVHTPWQLVVSMLVLPCAGAWTIGLERSRAWQHTHRAREPHGAALAQAVAGVAGPAAVAGIRVDGSLLQTHGHFNSCLLLGTGTFPAADEFEVRPPAAAHVLRETDGSHRVAALEGHFDTLRFCFPNQSYVLSTRTAPR